MFQEILGVVLGGGRGTRLYPLTKFRSKPAVPVLGLYRLIDIPLSNLINSGIRRIFVLTQFNSESLNRHISHTYNFDVFSGGFVSILAAEQTLENADWYQGTADAVRKNLPHISSTHHNYTLILSGDQIYKMNFAELLKFHTDNHNDATVCVIPVGEDRVSSFGVVKLDGNVVVDFAEKPKDEKIIEKFRNDDSKTPFLASMGIYLFNKSVLEKVLTDFPDMTDFGNEIIPETIKNYKVGAYKFSGFWEDVGTVRAYFETSLKFSTGNPPLNLHDARWKFFTRPVFLPPAKFKGAEIVSSMITEGSIIGSAVIENSIIGPRTVIKDGAVIRNSIVLGADFYSDDVFIGEDVVLDKVIVDKNVRLEKGVVVKGGEFEGMEEGKGFTVRNGIPVIWKGTVISEGADLDFSQKR